MMMNNIGNYTFTAADKVFFDANVLIYIDGPIGLYKPNLQKKYGDAYNAMLTSGVEMYVSTLVLSEFINVWLRSSFETYNKRLKSSITFKYYRNSKDYECEIKTLCSVLKKRLNNIKVVDIDCDNYGIVAILTDLETSPSDYNDHIHARTCILHGLSMLTHDGDMKNFSIPLISANESIAPLNQLPPTVS